MTFLGLGWIKSNSLHVIVNFIRPLPGESLASERENNVKIGEKMVNFRCDTQHESSGKLWNFGCEIF